ncbi:VanZ family protein [Neobacillus niacini]|uniref:VanZ family protein n=1 Tax=Neobacillus niacini TaxID=86668 RepID=UPI002FFDD6E9
MSRANIVIKILFIIYLLLLIKVLLFKYPFSVIVNRFSLDYSWEIILNNSNFIPFKTINLFLFEANDVHNSVKNLLGNIIVFVPFGFLLPMVFSRLTKFLSVIFLSFAISLLFEVTQLLFRLGSFDVDDLILNTAGSGIGFLLFRLFKPHTSIVKDSTSTKEGRKS